MLSPTFNSPVNFPLATASLNSDPRLWFNPFWLCLVLLLLLLLLVFVALVLSNEKHVNYLWQQQRGSEHPSTIFTSNDFEIEVGIGSETPIIYFSYRCRCFGFSVFGPIRPKVRSKQNPLRLKNDRHRCRPTFETSSERLFGNINNIKKLCQHFSMWNHCCSRISYFLLL